MIERLERNRISLSILPFRGKVKKDPNEWLREYNNAAKASGWNITIKLKLVIAYLKGNTLDWFEDHQDEIVIWKEIEEDDQKAFETEFIKKYTTQERRNLWFNQFNNLEQKEDESVETYTSKFKKLKKKVSTEDRPILEEIIKQRYLSELKEDITSRVVEFCLKNFDEILKVAKRIEKGKLY